MDTVIPGPMTLGNTWQEDAALRRWMDVAMQGVGGWADAVRELDDLGGLCGGALHALSLEAEANPPRLQGYDVFGARVDRIHQSHAWQTITRIGVERGLVACGHDGSWGAHARLSQLARLVLFTPSSAFVGCPMAMTDGAATVLRGHLDHPTLAHARERLLSTDPGRAWSSGQWMTEILGGSDVSRTKTVARDQGDGTWRLWGTKFFTSATTADCTLLLARPEGAPDGSRGLALFYLEPWNADGSPNAIRVRRLKEKLGTRAMPTAELELEGTAAVMLGQVGEGVRRIAGVLNIARYHNTATSAGFMARSLQMARAFARQRVAFGHRLTDLPAHIVTLGSMQAEYEGALAIAVRLAVLLGRVETGEATADEMAIWRGLTPLAKLGTGKAVVAQASEGLEALGGSGYMEDSGAPVVLRDAQVLPIWEGTTNVLSLDLLRAEAREGGMGALLRDAEEQLTRAGRWSDEQGAIRQALCVLTEAHARLAQAGGEAQSGARAMALSLYRTYAASLLWAHVAECADRGLDTTGPLLAAREWQRVPLVQPVLVDADRTRALRAWVFPELEG
jgi:alkylation response protein AidB-like acyl-CoA dehydrogenase